MIQKWLILNNFHRGDPLQNHWFCGFWNWEDSTHTHFTFASKWRLSGVESRWNLLALQPVNLINLCRKRVAELCECSVSSIFFFFGRPLSLGFGGLPRGRRNLGRPRLAIKESLFKICKINDFVKGHPYEKSVILINFHGFNWYRVILIVFTVMIIEKILLFWKLTQLFFEKFAIDNHHLDEQNLKKLIFLYIFYLVKTWISKISSRIFSRAISPTTQPSKKRFYFSHFQFFYSFSLR